MSESVLASYIDANQWLDGKKLEFEDNIDAAPEAKDASRLVRSFLLEIFPDHANNWDSSGTPEAVPVLVVTITAALMAGYRYAKVYSEETTKPNNYAEWLKTYAMDLLQKIKDGDLALTDVLYPTPTAFAETDFWPNNTDVDTLGNSNAKFTMGKVF